MKYIYREVGQPFFRIAVRLKKTLALQPYKTRARSSQTVQSLGNYTKQGPPTGPPGYQTRALQVAIGPPPRNSMCRDGAGDFPAAGRLLAIVRRTWCRVRAAGIRRWRSPARASDHNLTPIYFSGRFFQRYLYPFGSYAAFFRCCGLFNDYKGVALVM